MLTALIYLLFSLTLSNPLPRKVYDVHLHGHQEPAAQLAALQRQGVYAAAISSSWELQESYRSLKGPALRYGLMLPCPEGKVPYSRQSCYANGSEWPDPSWVEELARTKKISFLGEILSQYQGISSSDSSLYPYYAIAERYQLPVGIHTGSAGPDHGCPNFKESSGNPLLMKEMLDRFPRLRAWVMHAGLPYLEETIALMNTYPNVYADISVINNPSIIPSEKFAAIMKALVDAGFEDRLMFGSDNADIEVTIRAVEELEFLSPKQKEKIFYRNAERFFQRP